MFLGEVPSNSSDAETHHDGLHPEKPPRVGGDGTAGNKRQSVWEKVASLDKNSNVQPSEHAGNLKGPTLYLISYAKKLDI